MEKDGELLEGNLGVILPPDLFVRLRIDSLKKEDEAAKKKKGENNRGNI